MKKRFCLLLVLVMCVMALGACGSEGNTAPVENAPVADSSLQEVLDSGVLRVGMCPEYPPFESIDADNAIVGFDPALAAAIAEELGVTVECMNVPWEGLVAGVNNGDFDVIISAMSPEEATAATDAVELSKDYYVMSDIIVVADSNTDITGKDDLAGKIVGVQTASTAAHAAEGLPEAGIELAALNPYNRTADAYAELANGRIDAIIVSSSYARAQAQDNPGVKIINDPIHEVGLCVVAKDGAVALIKAIEAALDTLHANGTYEQIEMEWLGSDQ